ncbi:MAG: TIGR02449 family protein [Gammaproteobacteria bacterium]|nr:TIGR02449 family protein [Gammaproteobacteria bacterium]
MASDDSRTDNQDLKILESRIDELIEYCRRLKNENQSLKSEQNNLSEQHARLMEKTRLARARIETMIDRLKALERS